jgi:hypothetical protein
MGEWASGSKTVTTVTSYHVASVCVPSAHVSVCDPLFLLCQKCSWTL